MKLSTMRLSYTLATSLILISTFAYSSTPNQSSTLKAQSFQTNNYDN